MPRDEEVSIDDVVGVADPVGPYDTLKDSLSDPEPKFSLNLEFLKTQTGSGELEEYLNHPLNFNRSYAVGRIIRGITGFAGEMRYAVIDIFLGVLELRKSKAAHVTRPMGVPND
jgi:hypothetical protein